ncbi:outer membrane beta-barrel protein [Sphingobacterium sp. SRCM116780]|uniref:outer membrane beta-barrel protein n=1 Tax=Sphingobacterium sp. SRCM116780 TaxID=2907623 RepID=UPI001F2FE92A|nr:outer membrane beta-barrel protein [Sphingobacterium sp. SRCM116780]UIR57472.1 outer membrane beta-barrel protein [Sphingobacterium sp. SRCM116780]
MIVFVLLFFIGGRVEAQLQKKEVYGFVVDAEGQPLEGVNVRLTTSLDTVMTVSSKTGFYKFHQIKGNNIRLNYNLLGLQIVDRSYPQYNSTDRVIAETVTMKPQASMLKEIVINKYKPIIFKEDTVQFNMGAFQFDRRTLLEDALKQIPNFQVSRDGSVYAFGKPITSVQVDGKKFFGGDVLTATRNLPADFVKNIQVIDYYGDVANAKGTKGAESEKIINIVLKDDKKKITFGQVTGGIGNKDRYLASAGINKFNDGQELSFIGSINNTNTNLFSFGSPNGGGSRDRVMGELADFADPTDGFNNVGSLGASFSSNLTDKIAAYGRYTFTNNKNKTKGNSFLQSIYGYNTITNLEDYVTTTTDNTHQMNWGFDIKLTDSDFLKISPTFSWTKSNGDEFRDRYIKNKSITNNGNYTADNSSTSPNAELDVLYAKSFKKPGRKLVYNLHVGYNSVDKNEDIIDQNTIIDSAFNEVITKHNYLNQFVRSDNENRDVKSALSIIEPMDKGGLLELNYDFNYTAIDARRLVHERDNEQSVLNRVDSLSLNYDYIFSSNRIGMKYQQDIFSKFKYNIGFAVQPTELSGYSKDKSIKTSYSNVNLVPAAGIKWKFDENSDLSIDYLGKNNQPNFYQIQPVLDNTNSQNIVEGNPELRAEFANRILAKYRKSIVKKGQYFEGSLAYNFISDKIVSNRTTIANSTAQKTTFLNTPGYYDIKSYYLFTASLLNDNVQMSLNGNADFYNNVTYINDRRNDGGHFLFSQSLQFRYMFNDIFEAELNGNYSLNKATYKLPYNDQIIAHSGVLGLGSKYYVSEHSSFGMEISQRLNAGYSSSSWTNINPTIINAYFEYTFMRNKLTMLRVQGFDLLNQNSGITRDVLGNDILDVQNTRLSRYFMLSLNFRLQKYPKKS